MTFPKIAFWALALLSLSSRAQDTAHRPEGNQINGPALSGGETKSSEEREAWLRDLKIWRGERRTRMGFDDAEYRRPEFQWAQSNFISPQVMVEERTLFDAAKNEWTVDKYLDDLNRRYGGIDSVLLWPVYPNIGIDNRNQWDLTRDLPGGPEGIRKVVEQFHKRKVKVLFPTMAWDNGTRDPGMPHWQATAELMKELNVDGVNGDTFGGVPRAYRTASDRTGHPVLFEPEGPPEGDEGLLWNNESWSYWTFKFAPTASRQKWLEPRHMAHLCTRWARDKTDDLQHAFFNGLGYVSWENIWGIWNGITGRDAEALRRVASVERMFAHLLVSPNWEPFVPCRQSGVFATKFPGSNVTLWTFVNRNEYAVTGSQLAVEHVPNRRYFDVWNGVEHKPEIRGQTAVVAFDMEAHGYGALLSVDPGASVPNLDHYLQERRAMTKQPLGSLPHEWEPLRQEMVPVSPTPKPAAEVTAGMVKIPAGEFDFRVTGIEIEGFNWTGLDVQYPWEATPRRGHAHTMQMKSFWMDRYPVTNAEFKRFLDASRYRPADDHNFLRDWNNGSPQKGWESRPVTWVSIEDSRAYAQWAGKRLPHEWEWQYAAQGHDGRRYPWGNDWNAAAVPTPEKGRSLAGPSAVDSHPLGASPFGVMDLVGNVWQWTGEFQDPHTRAAILRGGSYYQPQGSKWYFPQAYNLEEHGKYLLMAPSKDRAATVGFRCVADQE